MRVSTPTRMHNIWGVSSYTMGHCYSCGNRVVSDLGQEKPIDHFYEGKLLCNGCLLQAKDGLFVERSHRVFSFSKCKVCGKKIKKRFSFCWEHFPDKDKVVIGRKSSVEIARDDKKQLEKEQKVEKKKSVFNEMGVLKKESGFCQRCGAICPKSEMICLVRTDRYSGKTKLFFCSQGCSKEVLMENQGLTFKKT